MASSGKWSITLHNVPYRNGAWLEKQGIFGQPQ
jgi:hypothetical protein